MSNVRELGKQENRTDQIKGLAVRSRSVRALPNNCVSYPALINPKLVSQCTVGSLREETTIPGDPLKLIIHLQATQVKSEMEGND